MGGSAQREVTMVSAQKRVGGDATGGVEGSVIRSRQRKPVSGAKAALGTNPSELVHAMQRHSGAFGTLGGVAPARSREIDLRRQNYEATSKRRRHLAPRGGRAADGHGCPGPLSDRANGLTVIWDFRNRIDAQQHC